MYQNYYFDSATGQMRTPTVTVERDGSVVPLGWIGEGVPSYESSLWLGFIAGLALPNCKVTVLPRQVGMRGGFVVKLSEGGQTWEIDAAALATAFIAAGLGQEIEAVKAAAKSHIEGGNQV